MSIKVNDLTPEATYYVNGKVAYSRVSRHTTDEERMKDNQRRTYKIDKNYTNITIYDAVVQCKDASNPTTEDRYAAECMYKSHVDKYTGKSFAALNKGQELPTVRLIQEDGRYKKIKLTGELAQGLDVTLIMRVFKGKNAMNNGVTLDTILINEPLRYFSSSNKVAEDAKSRGIIWADDDPDEAEIIEDAPVEDTSSQPAAIEPAADDNPFTSAPQTTPAQSAQPAPADDNPFVTAGAKRQY